MPNQISNPSGSTEENRKRGFLTATGTTAEEQEQFAENRTEADLIEAAAARRRRKEAFKPVLLPADRLRLKSAMFHIRRQKIPDVGPIPEQGRLNRPFGPLSRTLPEGVIENLLADTLKEPVQDDSRFAEETPDDTFVRKQTPRRALTEEGFLSNIVRENIAGATPVTSQVDDTFVGVPKPRDNRPIDLQNVSADPSEGLVSSTLLPPNTDESSIMGGPFVGHIREFEPSVLDRSLRLVSDVDEFIDEAPRKALHIAQAAFNESITGVAYEMAFGERAFDLSGYDPGVIERLASTVLSFVMPIDALLLVGGGGVGGVLARKVVPSVVRKLVAAGVSEELATRAVASAIRSAAALGTYEGARPAIQGKFSEVPEAIAHGGAMGFLLGTSAGLSASGGLAARLGSEIGTFTFAGAALEGRLPNIDDLESAVGIVLGLKLQGKATAKIKQVAREMLVGKVLEGKTLQEAIDEVADDKVTFDRLSEIAKETVAGAEEAGKEPVETGTIKGEKDGIARTPPEVETGKVERPQDQVAQEGVVSKTPKEQKPVVESVAETPVEPKPSGGVKKVPTTSDGLIDAAIETVGLTRKDIKITIDKKNIELHGGKGRITIPETLFDDPRQLVRSVAHEAEHARQIKSGDINKLGGREAIEKGARLAEDKAELAVFGDIVDVRAQVLAEIKAGAKPTIKPSGGVTVEGVTDLLRGEVVSVGKVRFAAGIGHKTKPIGGTSVEAPSEIGRQSIMTIMKANSFRKLASQRGFGDKESVAFIDNAIKSGRTISIPFLDIRWDSRLKLWKITGHEGRGRMESFIKSEGNQNVPVVLRLEPSESFTRLTTEQKSALSESFKTQGGGEVFFNPNLEIIEKPIITPSRKPSGGVKGEVELGIRSEKTKNIKADPKRFQNRETEFSEETVKRIVDDFDQSKLDPITVFKDPKTGDQIILSGHSRFEALKRLGIEDVPVRDFKGSEAEAIQFAKVEANRLQTKETLKEDVRAFRAAKDSGATKKSLENTFGPKEIGRLEAYTNLDPKGKLLDLLDQGIFKDHPFLTARARTIGELRKRFPELTNTHEKQIFDQLYPTDKATGLAKQMGSGVLEAIVENQVGDALFTKDQPIKLKKDFKPQAGARARSDTGPIVRKIDELEGLMKKNAREIKDPTILQRANADIQGQIEKLKAGIKDIIGRQTGLDLGGPVVTQFRERIRQGASVPNSAQLITKARIVDKNITFDKDLNTVRDQFHLALSMERETTGKLPRALRGSKDKPIGVNNIWDYAEKAFEVPIRIGRVNRRKAAGIYKERVARGGSQVVRVRDISDLPSISHEVAHHVDNIFGVKKLWEKSKSLKEELGKLDYDIKKNRPNEGFAELMNFWLTGMADPAKMAPEFNKVFTEFLKGEPGLKAKLENLRALIIEFRKQGSAKRLEAAITLDRPVEPDRVSNLVTKFQTLMVDVFTPIRKFERAIEESLGRKLRGDESAFQTATAIKNSAQAKAQNWVYRNTIDFDGKVTGKSMIEILRTAPNGEIVKAIEYSYAKHSIERWDQGKNPGIALADAQHEVLKRQTPELDKFAKDFSDYRDRLLQYVVDSGGFDPEVAKKFREIYEFSVPLYRTGFEGKGGGGGKKFVNLPTPIKRAKGSGRVVVNPLAGMLTETERLIDWADRQRIGGMLVKVAEKVEGTGLFVEEVPASIKATNLSVRQVVEQLAKEGLLVDITDPKKFDEMLTFFSRQARGVPGDNIVTIYRDGKPRMFKLSKDLFAAVTRLNQEALPPWMKLLSIPKKVLVAGATGFRASFGLVTNAIRDPWTYFMQSQTSTFNPFRPLRGLWDVAKKKTGIFSTSAEAQLWYNLGGEFTTFFNSELPKAMSSAKSLIKDAEGGTAGRVFSQQLSKVEGDWARKLEKTGIKAINVVRHPIDLYREIINVPESGPRVTEFKDIYNKVLKETGSHRAAWIEGLNASKDVTLNFSRSGFLANQVNQLVPFFNPAIQDWSVFVRSFKRQPIKTMLRGMSLTAITLAIWGRNKDEDWYKALPPWRRISFWNFKYGDTIWSIPRPFSWGIVFAAIPEGLADAAYRKDPSIAIEILAEAAKNALPPYMPAFAGPLLEVNMNYDLFRGRNIVSPFKERQLPPSKQFGRFTTETSKFLGSVLNISPTKIDHYISSTTGGGLTDIIRAGEAFFNPKPGRNKLANTPFIGRLVARNPFVGYFYSELSQLEDAVKEIKFKENPTDVDFIKMDELKRLRAWSSEFGKIRKAIIGIEADKSLSLEERDSNVETLENLLEELAHEALFDWSRGDNKSE